VAGSCEHGNEHSVSQNAENFLCDHECLGSVELVRCLANDAVENSDYEWMIVNNKVAGNWKEMIVESFRYNVE
jgi:hypothetical protein